VQVLAPALVDDLQQQEALQRAHQLLAELGLAGVVLADRVGGHELDEFLLVDASALEQLRDELARARKSDSVMILSGFPEDDLPRGFPEREVLRKEGWACVIC